jgi:hypothetical protein
MVQSKYIKAQNGLIHPLATVSSTFIPKIVHRPLLWFFRADVGFSRCNRLTISIVLMSLGGISDSTSLLLLLSSGLFIHDEEIAFSIIPLVQTGVSA